VEPTGRSLPAPTPTSAPFWDGLRAGVLRLQRCTTCAIWVYYPRSHCPGCLDRDLAWEEVSTDGVVHSVTVARQSPPGFPADQPQALAIVELDAGPRLPTWLVADDPAEVRIGDRVRAIFEHVDADHTLLRFTTVEEVRRRQEWSSRR
jgi:uncharacterized OB-fold protein